VLVRIAYRFVALQVKIMVNDEMGVRIASVVEVNKEIPV